MNNLNKIVTIQKKIVNQRTNETLFYVDNSKGGLKYVINRDKPLSPTTNWSVQMRSINSDQ